MGSALATGGRLSSPLLDTSGTSREGSGGVLQAVRHSIKATIISSRATFFCS